MVSQTDAKYTYCVDKYTGLVSEFFGNVRALLYLINRYARGDSILQIMPHPLDLIHLTLSKLGNRDNQYFYIRHNPVGFKHVNSRIRNLFISYIDDINTRRADRIFFFSKSVMDTFSKNSSILNKSTYVGFGFNKFGAKENLNMLCASPATLLFFGRILPYKGLDDLLQSLEFVRGNVKLIIAGKELTDHQKFLISSLKVPIEIHNEWITDAFADHLYSIADVVVLPYRAISQSGPLLTAIGYRVPIIAPNLEGVKEFVIDDFNGLLFKVGDIFDLAEKIDQIISNEQYYKLKRNSKSLRDSYDWCLVAERLMKAINNVHT